MNLDCSTGTVIRAVPDFPDRHAFWRADCKRMSCPRCGEKKARLYRRAIAAAAEALGLKRFLTLTLDPDRAGSPEHSVEYIRKAWNKFRTYLARKFGARVQFIAVLELQKSGMAHLHVLIDRYIPKDWLDNAWNAVGGGFTWAKFVDVHRVSGYLTKYLTKEMFTAVASKKKRISTSRGIRLFPKRASKGWWFDRGRITKHLNFRVKSRRGIVNVQDDEAGLKSFESIEPTCADKQHLSLGDFAFETSEERL
jgi:hypothetical protein